MASTKKPAAKKPAAKAKAPAKAAPAKKPAAAAKTDKAPSAAFTSIVASLGQNPGIGTRKMFGAHGLNLGGRAFAMEYKGALVVKLPAARADALVADGTGAYFDPGMGRPMKEWLTVAPGRGDWHRLAEEALAYAGTLPPK